MEGWSLWTRSALVRAQRKFTLQRVWPDNIAKVRQRHAIGENCQASRLDASIRGDSTVWGAALGVSAHCMRAEKAAFKLRRGALG